MTARVRHHNCESWHAFIDAIRHRRPGYASKPFIYRGQSAKWTKLQSTWERVIDAILSINPDIDNVREFAKDGLSDRMLRFMNHARGLPSVSTKGLNEDDWLCLARHHGLNSPLLDWTRNPYVATFFACIDVLEETNPGLFSSQRGSTIRCPDNDVCVWAIWPIGIDKQQHLRVIDNRLDDFHRQRAQSGLFTELDHPECIDLVEFFDKHATDGILDCFILPKFEVGNALCDLNIMGINFALLFPDLDGAAKQSDLEPIFSDIKILSRND